MIADGVVDNAPMLLGRSKSREITVLFIFCVLLYYLIGSDRCLKKEKIDD